MRSFLLPGKTGKRLSEFLQKYTGSGTETTRLAGYNILVFLICKDLYGPTSTFHGGNSRTKLKNQILHNLAMFTSNVLNNKRFRQMKHARL